MEMSKAAVKRYEDERFELIAWFKTLENFEMKIVHKKWTDSTDEEKYNKTLMHYSRAQ